MIRREREQQEKANADSSTLNSSYYERKEDTENQQPIRFEPNTDRQPEKYDMPYDREHDREIRLKSAGLRPDIGRLQNDEPARETRTISVSQPDTSPTHEVIYTQPQSSGLMSQSKDLYNSNSNSKDAYASSTPKSTTTRSISPISTTNAHSTSLLTLQSD